MKSSRDSFSVSSIEQLAEQQQKYSYLLGGLGLIGAPILGIVLAAYGDTILVLPAALRWGILILGLIGICAGAYLVWSRAKSHSANSAAATFEAAHPEVGQRIRTAVDLRKATRSNSPEAVALREQLGNETRAALTRFSWKELIPKKTLIFSALGLVAFGVFAMVALIQSPDLRIGMQRVLNPATEASYTNLSWAYLSKDFDERKPIRLGVTVSRRVSEPKVYLRPVGEGENEWEEVPLTALDERGKWDAILADRRSSLEVYAEAGDARTPIQTIQYHPLPKLLSSQILLKFPDYLGRSDETINRGDVKAVEGTEVTWSFAFNHPPLRTEWQLGPKVDGDLKPDSADGVFRSSHQLAASKLNASLTVYAYDGEPVSTWRYQVEGLADQMPKVAIFEPKKEMKATPVGEFPVRIRATDDHGVAEIGLVLESAGEKDWILEEVVETSDQKRIDRVLHAMLEKVPLTIQDNVRLYAYALDHRPRGGPRAVSQLVPVEIVPFKIRSIFSKEGGAGGPDTRELQEKLIKLNELVKNQRAIVSDLFQLKTESDTPSHHSLRNQGHRQRTLGYRGEGLLDQWIERGDLPRDDINLLSVSLSQMSEAAEELRKYRAEPGFISSDRALSNLLQLRKKWINIIRKKSGNDEPKDRNFYIPLSSLIAEAERLAREEADLQRQLQMPEPNIAVLRRQQELVVADAGELFAKLVNHPEATRGALNLMELAEKMAIEANDRLYSDQFQEAAEPLEAAENAFNDLADFLRALEVDTLSESLRQLAEKAKKNSEDVEKAAEEAEIEKEGQKKGEGKPGEKAPGSKPGEGSPGSLLADAGRETDLLEEILKALAEKSGKSTDPSGESKKEALDDLMSEAKAKELAESLKAMGEQAKEEGLGKVEKDDLEDAAQRLKKMARKLEEVARELDASELNKLMAAKEAGEALLEELQKLPKEGSVADGSGDGDSEENESDNDSQTGRSSEGGNGLGLATTRFVDRMKQLSDRQLRLRGMVYESTELDHLMIEHHKRVIEAIERAIAKIPKPAVLEEAPRRVPQERRREVEDYFRDLSDDLEDEGLTSLSR